MLLLGLLSLYIFSIVHVLGFNLNGVDYESYNVSEGEVTKRIIYPASSTSPEKEWIVKSIYNNSYLKTG